MGHWLPGSTIGDCCGLRGVGLSEKHLLPRIGRLAQMWVVADGLLSSRLLLRGKRTPGSTLRDDSSAAATRRPGRHPASCNPDRPPLSVSCARQGVYGRGAVLTLCRYQGTKAWARTIVLQSSAHTVSPPVLLSYLRRRTLRQHYMEKYGVEVPTHRIFVTTGSSAAFPLAFLSAFDVGDKVAVASSSYPCYRHVLNVLGGSPPFAAKVSGSVAQSTTLVLRGLFSVCAVPRVVLLSA